MYVGSPVTVNSMDSPLIIPISSPASIIGVLTITGIVKNSVFK